MKDKVSNERDVLNLLFEQKMSGERSGKKGYMVMKEEGASPRVALIF